MIFPYNDVSHVYKEHEKKMGDLVINSKLTQPEFEAKVKELKAYTKKRLVSERFKGIPKWKIVANWVLPLVIIAVGVVIKRSLSH